MGEEGWGESGIPFHQNRHSFPLSGPKRSNIGAAQIDINIPKIRRQGDTDTAPNDQPTRKLFPSQSRFIALETQSFGASPTRATVSRFHILQFWADVALACLPYFTPPSLPPAFTM